MNDFRCKQCNRLLARVEGETRVEIKCPRCKTMNLYSKEIYITIEQKDEICTDPEIVES